jgi:hypothetical protein
MALLHEAETIQILLKIKDLEKKRNNKKCLKMRETEKVNEVQEEERRSELKVVIRRREVCFMLVAGSGNGGG